jgi:hypothetical protein
MSSTQTSTFDYDAFLRRVDEALKHPRTSTQECAQTSTFDYDALLRRLDEAQTRSLARVHTQVLTQILDVTQTRASVPIQVSTQDKVDTQDASDEPEFVVWRSDSGFPVHCRISKATAKRFQGPI